MEFSVESAGEQGQDGGSRRCSLAPARLPGVRSASAAGDSDLLVRRKIWSALGLLALLLLAVALSGLFFRQEMTGFANWIYGHLGFGGMAAIVFVSETLVSPIPPDLILWIIASSDLSREWLGPVSILAFLSTLGGHVGWLLGSRLGNTRPGRFMVARSRRRTGDLMKRYGIWAVVLAALTPVPWSFTSWTAGFFKMPWHLYLVGSLTRFPRHLLYYVFLHLAFHRGVEVALLL